MAYSAIIGRGGEKGRSVFGTTIAGGQLIDTKQREGVLP